MVGNRKEKDRRELVNRVDLCFSKSIPWNPGSREGLVSEAKLVWEMMGQTHWLLLIFKKYLFENQRRV